MEKQKPWQFYLIITVLLLTLYNILPTIFFYTKPLKAPIDEKRAEIVAHDIVDRVNSLKNDSEAWLVSYSKMLGVKPESIEIDSKDPQFIIVTLRSPKEAALFERFLPQAGAMIPFVPAQLQLAQGYQNKQANQVVVARQVSFDLKNEDVNKLFSYSLTEDAPGQVANLYKEIISDRVTQIALGFAGPSRQALQLKYIIDNPQDLESDEMAVALAKEIVDGEKIMHTLPTIAPRWYASFTQAEDKDSGELIQKFLGRLEGIKTRLTIEKDEILKDENIKKENGELLDFTKSQQKTSLDAQIAALTQASDVIKTHLDSFKKGLAPLTNKQLSESLSRANENAAEQIVSLQNRNPFVEALVVNWPAGQVEVRLYDDVQALRLNDGSEEAVYKQEKINQFIFADIARAATLSDETIGPNGDTFAVNLNTLNNVKSFLTLNLDALADQKSRQIVELLNNAWQPKQVDLIRENYPIRHYDDWKKENADARSLGLIVYAPAMYPEESLNGFSSDSIYVIAKGMDSILQKWMDVPENTQRTAFTNDFNQLKDALQAQGFIGYSGSQYGSKSEFAKDYIFRLNDYYSALLKATREDFNVKGSKRLAVLDFSDVEQRILTENKIADRSQEDLLKWVEEYHQAQVDPSHTTKYLIPPPTKNPYWQNFKINLAKYFRGDDRKVLKWGLDLSGGKSVRIGLLDHNNRPVTNQEDLNQAVNELYTRVNKMGVAERTIRIENNNILLDFPGSQGLSASDLIKASAMSFHIVNEKFSPNNPALRDAVQQFLQTVWNEAVVTNKKDVDSINEIAWKHLGGESLGNADIMPMSDSARILWDSGLRLANPKTAEKSSAFNDSLSMLAMLRGEDFVEWNGQPNPLIIVFHNYALEGSSLSNINVGYDPSQGNVLSFNVKSSYDGAKGESGANPRDDFYTWTSQFAEDRIVGTPKEAYSRGKGWQMAVILNGRVISRPMLVAALRDGGTITGRFTQREINQLAADLKAGSLSFTPKILSEENISPELGKEERTKGIIASLAALAAVVVVMVSYYRFAGVVASCAVIFNILIMWGVLQNIEAALTLPGIAGIVLTIGMAIDANVLVFERFREEFKQTGRLATAIQSAYRKAFSAIVDSNLTTIIAALILIQYDAGPVKGFAVTLIIGIVSSMFTALFMTRYFFAGWVQNPKNRELKMSQLIGETKFDFLGKTRIAIILSVIAMLVGTALFVEQRKTIFGMDFTGGYSLTVEMKELSNNNDNYRLAVADALVNAGASANDVDVRELSRPTQLRIQLGMGLEQPNGPFHGLPEELSEGKFTYEWQKNPRIDWIVDALTKANLQIEPIQMENLQRDWNVMSGQFSDAMRNNAIKAISLALLAILIYITVRFEFKFAVGAVVGLIHDVIITLGIVALFHKLGMPVQIDLESVGAIMMIIGYSLNDTIIVFDRIREDINVHRKWKFTDLINHALNITLSRTIMTSGTTILVLMILTLLGGKSIFGFALVMTVGIIVGTLSSLFVAAPVMLFVHNREETAKMRELQHKA